MWIMVAGFLITAIGSAPSIGTMASEGLSFKIPEGQYMLILAMVATTMVPDIPVSLSALHKKKYMSSDSPEFSLPLESKLKLAHFDLIVGCSVTAIITISIMICAAANLHPLGVVISSCQDMAGALTPILGKYAGVLFTLGLWSAAFSSGMFRIELMPLLYNQATGQEEDMRITEELLTMLKKYQPIWINTHFTHPREITPESGKACAAIVDAGIPLGNQTVLLRGINDRTEILKELFLKLVHLRVRPYYLYQCDLSRGIGHFRTTVDEGIEIMGYATPEAVMNAWMNSPGHRANILNASYTQIGVGYVADGNYWTQEFTG